MTHLEVQATTTQTGAFVGPQVDISGITNDWTLKLQVANLTPAAKNARFVFRDSVNSFTAILDGPSFSLQGALTKSADVVLSVKAYQFPSLRFGVANALLRLDLEQLDSAATTTYHAWIEY